MDRLVLLERGARQVRDGDLASAEASYRAMLEPVPDDAEALSNLAVTLNLRECHDVAEAMARAALVARPGYWAALAALGVALHRQQRHDEAVQAYFDALRANPGDVNSCTNLGVALNEQWRMTEALAAHDAAVQEAPEDAVIRSNRAMARLIAGDLACGFAEFEWRWRVPGAQAHGVGGPRWCGEPLGGRTLLVHDEGGFGDTLQFVRYVPLLLERGARVVLQVQPPLLRLMSRSFPGADAILARGDVLPPYDLHCPMISLAQAFATTLETVPASSSYLVPDPTGVAAWQARLATSGHGLRVGLVWAGASRPGEAQVHTMDRRRSMPLSQLAPLADVKGVQFISLQLGAPAIPPPRLMLGDPMAEMRDFDDTASLVANLDLVIAVDTAVAHLAGALGRPVWVMSRFDACWRWLAHRSDSPWYPTLKLYRQQNPGDWGSVVAAVARDLEAAVRLSSAPSRAA